MITNTNRNEDKTMRAKKYIAWIITAAMLVTSIPFSEKRIKADVLPEGTQMKFVVKDIDGTIIKNSEDPDEEKILKFKIGDEETEAVFSNDEYTIDIDGNIHIFEGETAHISVTAAKKGEWKKYEKTFTIELKAVDSYIKVYVDGTK